jgi:hypothetical protein
MRDMSNHIYDTMHRVRYYHNNTRDPGNIRSERRHGEAYLHIVMLATHRFRTDRNIVNITT